MTGKDVYAIFLRAFQLFPLAGPILFFIDAPHGKFSPDLGGTSLGLPNIIVNGTLAWIMMEIPSPLILLYAFSTSPLATAPNFSLTSTNPTATFLLVLFLTHYANRAIVSPLRTPTRSRIHWMIPLVAVGFNTLNAYLIGSWLGSGVVQPDAWRRSPAFWIGIGMFAVGFVGNVWHDEILIRIRREKMREEEETAAKGKGGKPHYAIPYGGMYRFISYPNYLCEWIEWAGYAVAASVASGWVTPFYGSPPWLFVINEVATMFPRALSGHRWYHTKFKDYPKERKAVVPYLL